MPLKLNKFLLLFKLKLLRIAQLRIFLCKRQWKDMVIERARLSPLPQEHNGKYKAEDNIIKEDYTWEKIIKM